jgi:hypothetical protein
MFKRFLTIVLAIGLIFSLTMPAKAANKDMWAYVYSWDGTVTGEGKLELTRITSGVTFAVMMADSSATLETLYYYDTPAMTSLANPVTGTSFADNAICNDMVRFRVDPTETGDADVDLMVVNQSGGYSAFVEDFNEYKHSIIIDQRPNIRHHGYAFIVTTGSSSEIDTGIDFPDDSVIDMMLIEVGTGFAGGTTPLLNVGILSSGTNGDANGFIESCDVATAGYNDPYRAGIDLTSYSVSSGGEDGAIINSGVVGTLLGHMDVGTSDTGDGHAGGIYKSQLLIHGTWENSLTYTFGTSHASTGWGVIHFWFTRIR